MNCLASITKSEYLRLMCPIWYNFGMAIKMYYFPYKRDYTAFPLYCGLNVPCN